MIDNALILFGLIGAVILFLGVFGTIFEWIRGYYDNCSVRLQSCSKKDYARDFKS